MSVVIVTYNSASLIDRCLAPIYGRSGVEIVIVDNDSRDGTADKIQQMYPEVVLVQSPGNLGFARGNNSAFRSCSAEHVLLLNPDALLDDLSQIYALIDAFDPNEKIAFVGPQLKNEDGSHQIGDAGWRDSLLSTAGHFLFLHRVLPSFPSLYLTRAALMRETYVDVDWICGACLLTRRDVIETIGGLCTDYFMYGEDVEWGERARNAGYLVRYVPGVKVLHLQGATQRREGDVFFSTRWLEVRAKKHAKRSNARFRVFCSIALLGFALRWGIEAICSLVGGSGKRGRQDAYAKYFGFVFKKLRYSEVLR